MLDNQWNNLWEDQCGKCPASVICVSGNARFIKRGDHAIVELASSHYEIIEFDGEEEIDKCPRLRNKYAACKECEARARCAEIIPFVSVCEQCRNHFAYFDVIPGRPDSAATPKKIPKNCPEPVQNIFLCEKCSHHVDDEVSDSTMR